MSALPNAGGLFCIFVGMNAEKQRIEQSARQKFEALADDVKAQFGAMMDREQIGAAFWLLRRQGFVYSEAARFIMFVQELESTG